MLTGNKGEWSEIYALLKILSDQKLYAGDSDLNKLESLIFPVIKVLRDESNGTYEYKYDRDIVLIKGDKEEYRISISEFQKQAQLVFSEIKNASNSTFSIPDVERFMNSFGCVSLKAKSTVKSDINIVIHDQRTGTTPQLGFSIKSQLGGASTLLNAGKTTNFVYDIKGVNLSNTDINQVNSIDSRSKIKDRIEKIQGLGGHLEFDETAKAVFGNNLTLIDSALPKILSDIIYSFFTSSNSKMADLLEEVSRKNPLNFNMDTQHPFYEYKIKRFLTDVALGMMPSKVWKGELEATGGYLIVKEDGDIICYHIYNRNEFEDYLLKNTKLETASSSRHGFGYIYQKDGKNRFNLNLQIRFIK